MIKNYNTILFDLDGTLTDPGIGITNSVMYALEKWGISVPDRALLYPFIGPPLRESFALYYHFSPEEAERATSYYREYFSTKGLLENCPYEGIDSLLATLAATGKALVVATSKPEEFAKQILEHFDLSKYFSRIAGATMDESRTSKSDVISYALSSFGIDADAAIMIGDREHDILGAKQNSLDSIGVLYGYGSREELICAGATHLAENIEDLRSLLIPMS